MKKTILNHGLNGLSGMVNAATGFFALSLAFYGFVW